MNRKLAGLTAAMALLTSAVAQAAPASADVPCTITGFTPRQVVVGLSPVTATFKVTTSGCSRQGWSIEADRLFVYVYDGSPQETFNPYSNSDAGSDSMIVEAYNEDYDSRERVFANAFSLKRATAFKSGTFNASPEPVRRGKPITVKGQLLIADWTNDRYVGYGGRSVALQFRTPSGAYKTIKNVTSASDGWVSTTVTASTSGYWRLAYGGNTIAGSTNVAGDYVQVTS